MCLQLSLPLRLSPFTLFLSLIPAVLRIKREINTPLKCPNTNNQVLLFLSVVFL